MILKLCVYGDSNCGILQVLPFLWYLFFNKYVFIKSKRSNFASILIRFALKLILRMQSLNVTGGRFELVTLKAEYQSALGNRYTGLQIFRMWHYLEPSTFQIVNDCSTIPSKAYVAYVCISRSKKFKFFGTLCVRTIQMTPQSFRADFQITPKDDMLTAMPVNGENTLRSITRTSSWPFDVETPHK